MVVIRRNGQLLPKTPPRKNPFKGDKHINPSWSEDGPPLGPSEDIRPVTAQEVFVLLHRHRDRELIKDMVLGLIPTDGRLLNSDLLVYLRPLDERLEQLKDIRRKYGQEHPRSWDDRPPRTPTPRNPPRTPLELERDHEADLAKWAATRKARLARWHAEADAGNAESQAKLDRYRERNRKAQRAYRQRAKDAKKT